MSEVINKHSRMPRKLSRMTLRRREQEAIGGVHSLSEVNPQGLVARYVAGEKIKDIAKEYGVNRIAIYQFLLRLVPDEWKEAQRAKAFAMKEQGEDRIQSAKDPLELAIGREETRAGQWDLERVYRPVYGRDEQTLNINITDLGDRLRRARERVINAEHQVIEDKEHLQPSSNARAQGEKVAA